ncbi:hypothetical protein LQW54_006996 [Pestalotiopsis sp. IQ-011]
MHLFYTTHKRLLCWTPIPQAGNIHVLHLLMVAIEATFTFLHDVPWLFACTHAPLIERPRGQHEWTEQQIEEYAERRLARQRHLWNISEDRQKAREGLRAYLDRKLKARMAWTRKNHAKVLLQARGTRIRAKASNRFRCDVCGRSLALKTALQKHLDSAAHKEQVRLADGGVAKEPGCKKQTTLTPFFHRGLYRSPEGKSIEPTPVSRFIRPMVEEDRLVQDNLSFLESCLTGFVAEESSESISENSGSFVTTASATVSQEAEEEEDETLAPEEILDIDEQEELDDISQLFDVDDKAQGVYTLVLEKENFPPRLYIGSGTNATAGVASRFKDYEKEVVLPKLVKVSLEEGFRISHKGLLCWTPIPIARKVPVLRLLMAIEATFTFLFFAAKESLADGFWKTLP